MLRAAAFSNVGNIRSNHEDNYLLGFHNYINEPQRKLMINNLITSHSIFEGEKGIFAICDGMGGHSAGEVASRMAVQWLNEKYTKLVNGKPERLESYIDALNKELCSYAEQNPECRDMGSTLAGLIFSDYGLYCINVGDSRIYRFFNNQLKKISIDHTEGERMLKLQLLTEKELESFASRKNLYKYLGYSGRLVADIQKIEAKKNDFYLICSDGVTDVLEDALIRQIFLESHDSYDIGKKLLERALATGTRCADNVTVIVLQFLNGKKG